MAGIGPVVEGGADHLDLPRFESWRQYLAVMAGGAGLVA